MTASTEEAMRNKSGRLLHTVGVGGLALLSGATVSVVAGATTGAVVAALGVTVALMSLLPILLPLPAAATAHGAGSRTIRSVRLARPAPDGGSRGAVRAAEVKRHTSMICR
jgi:hypothetical protein